MASPDAATAATTTTNIATATDDAKHRFCVFIRKNDVKGPSCIKCLYHTSLYAYCSSRNAPFSDDDLYKLDCDCNNIISIVLYERATEKAGCTNRKRWFVKGTQRYSFNSEPRQCESVKEFKVSYETLLKLMEKFPTVDGLGTPLDETTLGDSSSLYKESYNKSEGILDNASKCDCYATCVSCSCNLDGGDCACECVCDGDCEDDCACRCDCHDDCHDDCDDYCDDNN